MRKGAWRAPAKSGDCFELRGGAERPQCGKQRGGARAKQGEKRAAHGYRLCFAPVRVGGSSPTWGANQKSRPSGRFFDSLFHWTCEKNRAEAMRFGSFLASEGGIQGLYHSKRKSRDPRLQTDVRFVTIGILAYGLFAGSIGSITGTMPLVSMKKTASGTSVNQETIRISDP